MDLHRRLVSGKPPLEPISLRSAPPLPPMDLHSQTKPREIRADFGRSQSSAGGIFSREREHALACSRASSPARTQRHVLRVPDREHDSAGNPGTGTRSACVPRVPPTTLSQSGQTLSTQEKKSGAVAQESAERSHVWEADLRPLGSAATAAPAPRRRGPLLLQPVWQLCIWRESCGSGSELHVCRVPGPWRASRPRQRSRRR